MKAKIGALEKRLEALEKEKNSCDCAEKIRAMLDSAINSALADVRLNIQCNGVLENNAIGQLGFNTSVSYGSGS